MFAKNTIGIILIVEIGFLKNFFIRIETIGNSISKVKNIAIRNLIS